MEEKICTELMNFDQNVINNHVNEIDLDLIESWLTDHIGDLDENKIEVKNDICWAWYG